MMTSTRQIHVEWGDCDPAGIVFYPRYFAWFDACTSGLFDLAGLPKPEMLKRYGIIGIPMVDTRAKFIIPSKFGETVSVSTHIVAFHSSSFEVEHRLTKGDLLAVEAQETRVWTGRHPDDPERLKSYPIPDDVKARFA